MPAHTAARPAPRRRSVTIAVLAVAALVLVAGRPAQAADPGVESKPRVIVTTDPELDDLNSMIRYLLYTNELETEGLIYASSRFHWAGDGEGTEFFLPDREYDTPQTSWRWTEEGSDHIDEALDAYAQVYDNLVVHDPQYPTPAELRSTVRVGNVEFEGDISEETPGSQLIEEVLLDDEGGPVYLLAWGGPSTIARALKSIQEDYEGTPQWPAIYEKVSEKAIIQAFVAQDPSYADYIAPNWPDVEFRDMATTQWGYFARRAVLPEFAHYLSAEWLMDNVSSHGPLGELYRVWGDGIQMHGGDVFDYFGEAGLTADELRALGYQVWMPPQEQYSWISEGDTSTFLNLVDNGLRSHEDASWSGWGGPLETRFFEDAMLDFAARLDWSVTDEYDDANHPPTASVPAPRLDVSARPGQRVPLTVRVSDPDGDDLDGTWWHDEESGTYGGDVAIRTVRDLEVVGGRVGRAQGLSVASVTVPADAEPGETIHVVLEVVDDGEPTLTHYQRVVITVR